MKTAFAYVRVSTKDQEKQGNSIPEQLLRIEAFASKQDIQIIKGYQDSSSAYHDENREQFNQMITDALQDRPNFIIVDDSSRFARTREVNVATKKLLRKHNIDLLFANEVNVNPRTTAGLWLDGIMEIKNEAFSMDIAFNTIRGMSGNLKSRDPETGWCYKNGGRPPYGYVINHLRRGTNSSSKPIFKSIWELDPENSKIAHMIIVDLYTKQEMSYQNIRDYLNERNIPGPVGKPWGISTIVEMLRENRLQQYAGTAFWNKENHQTVGTRFNPREEWIQVDNAHPAIITDEELQLALMRKSRARKNAATGRTNVSSFLFTGNNLEGMPMFVCSSCGGHVISYSSSSRRWRKYICGPSRYKGKAGCPDEFFVDQDWLENTIIAEIEKRYTMPERIEEIIKEVKEDIRTGFKEYNHALNDLLKDKHSLESQRQRLLDAIKQGINPAAVTDEVNSVQEKINQLNTKLNYLKNNPPTQISFDEEEIRSYFSNFHKAFNEAGIPERKRLIRTFVRQLELDPKNKEVRAAFYPDKVVQSIGAGNRT
jgi:site-specific DNA recombinase